MRVFVAGVPSSLAPSPPSPAFLIPFPIPVYACYGQVSKTAEHARAVPAINVTRWRTTNKVLRRSFASRQSARGELLVKNMGSVKRTTLIVCLGVSSEKSVVIIHMIIPFILLLLVKMFATTRKRSGLSFSCWLRSAVAG